MGMLSKKMMMLILGTGVYSPNTSDFTLDASDSFNRTNGALGDTDGAGIDGVTGGAGLTWVEKIGTWTITTNVARAATVAASNAVATVDTVKADGIICAKITTAGSNGIVMRYVDTSNYVRCYISTTAITLAEIVAGTASTLKNTPITYVAGADLICRLDGLRVGVEYNGTYIGSYAINAAFASSTLHGMWTNGAASTWNVNEWHFISLPAYQDIQHPSVVQLLAGEYLVTTPMRGDVARCAEFDLRQEKSILSGWAAASGTRHLFGIDLVTIATGAKVVLSAGTGMEMAGQIGADADLQGDYGYFGTGHQRETITAFSMTIPRLASIPRWKRVYCQNVRVDQTMNTIYPKDKATVIGTTTMRHVFRSTGLLVTRSHTYSAGYKLYNWYGGMMSIANPGVDTYQVGTEAAASMVFDDAAKNLNTQTDIYKAWLAAGDYNVCMRLPTGGPSDPADWSKAGGYKGWFKDNADHAGKFYANYVDTNFAGAVAAVPSAHVCEYYVEKQ